MFRKKERTLGKAAGRRYDLPLNKGEGGGFLAILIGLMTFLAMLTLSTSFVLGAMTARWSSGLENNVTVEIPVGDNDATKIAVMTAQIADILKQHPSVKSVHILDDNEISGLVKPWLGEDLSFQDIPLPGLIGVEINQADEETYRFLAERIRTIAPQARIDTHEEWLDDLLRFTGSLQLATIVLAIIVSLTTAIAVSGAVRSRMALHAREVELLHLMGATDSYISRQFQRHLLVLSLQGGVMGLIGGALAMILVRWVAGSAGSGLVPAFHLNITHFIMLAALPLIVAAIATLTAGKTVYHVLAKMP